VVGAVGGFVLSIKPFRQAIWGGFWRVVGYLRDRRYGASDAEREEKIRDLLNRSGAQSSGKEALNLIGRALLLLGEHLRAGNEVKDSWIILRVMNLNFTDLTNLFGPADKPADGQPTAESESHDRRVFKLWNENLRPVLSLMEKSLQDGQDLLPIVEGLQEWEVRRGRFDQADELGLAGERLKEKSQFLLEKIAELGKSFEPLENTLIEKGLNRWINAPEFGASGLVRVFLAIFVTIVVLFLMGMQPKLVWVGFFWLPLMLVIESDWFIKKSQKDHIPAAFARGRVYAVLGIERDEPPSVDLGIKAQVVVTLAGYPERKIGGILGYGEEEIKLIIREAQQQFGVKDTLQLILAALEAGAIPAVYFNRYEGIKTTPHLSLQEETVLLGLAQGKGKDEISQELGFSGVEEVSSVLRGLTRRWGTGTELATVLFWVKQQLEMGSDDGIQESQVSAATGNSVSDPERQAEDLAEGVFEVASYGGKSRVAAKRLMQSIFRHKPVLPGRLVADFLGKSLSPKEVFQRAQKLDRKMFVAALKSVLRKRQSQLFTEASLRESYAEASVKFNGMELPDAYAILDRENRKKTRLEILVIDNTNLWMVEQTLKKAQSGRVLFLTLKSGLLSAINNIVIEKGLNHKAFTVRKAFELVENDGSTDFISMDTLSGIAADWVPTQAVAGDYFLVVGLPNRMGWSSIPQGSILEGAWFLITGAMKGALLKSGSLHLMESINGLILSAQMA